MSLLRRYKSFNEVLTAFLPEKEIQVCRKAYLSYTRASDIFKEWLHSRGLADKSMRRITARDIADFAVYTAGFKYDRPTCAKFLMNLKVIFKDALKQKSEDHPAPCSAIHHKGLWQQMKEAQAQEEGAAKRQQKGQLLFESVPDPFSEQPPD